ncbi:CHASE2 domain-containing protein [Bowmanella dokdonensis]|uniref:Adenylate/guanylate cyclase domain-containing protein n=1 Tax=Bowmanella dokdonensis TaxID=751969 RepID=A0A939DMS3_9ALTE|nr:adenylate/guanylate cyclase domain-containing protein [Bowmanella dokdonensis]
MKKTVVGRRFLALWLLPLLLLLLCLILQFFPAKGMEQTLLRLEGLLYDAKIQYLPPWPRSVSNIQIVDIDERSLHEVGRMPWDRRDFARLTDKLSQAGALVIAFDILFSERQDNQVQQALSQWYQAGELPEQQWQRLRDKAQAMDADRQFARRLGETEAVLANLFHHHPQLQSGKILAGKVAQPEGAIPGQIKSYQGHAGPIPVLAEAASGQGFMNADADADGLTRRAALLLEMNGQLYPSLALETFRVYSLVERVQPSWVQVAGQAQLEGVRVGNALIRTDQQSRIQIPFRGPARDYPYSSAADVLSGRILDNRFDQAVVFVGTSATGLADLRATPTSLTFPGVEIHATVFDALISPQHLPYRPDWATGALAVQLVLLGLLCILLLPRFSPWTSFAATLLLLALVVGFNLWLWQVHVMDLPMVMPLVLVLVLSAYFICYGFLSEASRRQRVRNIFAQYLPPAHIDRLLNEPGSVSLAGEKKTLSVLFSDIRGFTSISEGMTAQELKLWLNQFFSPVTKAILENDGTIDKYVGDMVMAFWGAPLEEPEHASKSIQAAFAMLEALEQVNQSFAAQQQPLASIGIGINSGEMNVGDMGSDFRRSYTVIGDAVNLGSRLEGLTKFYGVEVLVSESTRALAGDFNYLLVDKVRVKGKQRPIRLCMPINPSAAEAFCTLCSQLNQAIEAYLQRDFEAARRILQQLPADNPLSTLTGLYLQRVQSYLQAPPPEDWDGTFVHTSK